MKVVLNTTATPEMISKGNYDACIVAVGAEQIKPNLPGIDGKNVVMGLDVFGNEDKLGKKVVIVGGGIVACETALHLYNQGKGIQVLLLLKWAIIWPVLLS